MSQCDAILEALRAGRSLTPIEALQEFGCFRLAARIADLRAAGHMIATGVHTTTHGKQVASYRLVVPKPRQIELFG